MRLYHVSDQFRNDNNRNEHWQLIREKSLAYGSSAILVSLGICAIVAGSHRLSQDYDTGRGKTYIIIGSIMLLLGIGASSTYVYLRERNCWSLLFPGTSNQTHNLLQNLSDETDDRKVSEAGL